MGAEWYCYLVKYQPNIEAALQALREREFAAGRYNPVVPFPHFPLADLGPAPGARHASIDEAREAAGESGTRSILDLDHVADAPDFCAAAPLADDVLRDLYGTTKPSWGVVEENLAFCDQMERSQGVYIVLYRDGEPTDILFAGYSFD